MRKVLILFVILLLMGAIPTTAQAEEENTPFTPIEFDGNSGFNSTNGFLLGEGTELNPFVMDSLNINGTGEYACIKISNTDSHFVIRNCNLFDAYEPAFGLDIFPDGHGIALENVTNAVIESNNIYSNNFTGIKLVRTENIRIVHNNITENNPGIYSYQSSNLSIEHNTFTDNKLAGVWLSAETDNATVSINSIVNNRAYGLLLSSSTNNTIMNNDFLYNNNVGVMIETGAYNNHLSGNWFSENNNNSHEATDDGVNNTWNSSDSGNYWSNWTGPDDNMDYIVDIPFSINGTAGAIDYYPMTSYFPPELKKNSVWPVFFLAIILIAFLARKRF